MTKLKQAVVFDIDGTLANAEHRLHFLAESPKNWTGFFEAMDRDTGHGDIIYLASMLSRTWPILIATGRPSDYRDVTMAWLDRYSVHYDQLYMRPAGDHRDDGIIKSEIHDLMIEDGYRPWIVFDDRDRVVKMWRDKGIRVLQVADGDF